MPANKRPAKREPELQRQNDELRMRLVEAEETLRAIREGEVDAVIVSGSKGEQVFSLVGSDSIYRLIVETMKEAAFTITFEGKILFCNAQFGRFVRQPLEQIIGHSLQEFVTEDSRAAAVCLLIAAQRQPVKQRLVFAAIDGTPVPAHVSANVLNQPDDRSICVVASDLTDLENSTELIQQLRHQQEALAASEERYRLAIKAANDAIWDLNLIAGTLHWNDTYATAFDGPPETTDPWQWWVDHIHPEDRERTARGLREAIDGVQNAWACEYRFLRSDRIWANINDRAYIARDASGKALRVVGAMQDLTERKRGEDAVRAAKELSDSLNRINTDIHSTFDIQEIMRRVIVEAAQAIECETAAISIQHGGDWIVRFVHGFPDELVGQRMATAEEPHAALALKTMNPVVINDAFHDERVNTHRMKEYGIRSVLVVPLAAGGQPLGVIFFNHHAAAIPFSEAQVDFAHKLAAAVSLALDNANQVEERKRAEESLRQLNDSLEQRVVERTSELQQSVNQVQGEQRRFHEVLDALPVYVILLTPDYRVSFANSFFESRFGRSEGRRCYEYLFQRTEPCENCETYKVFKTNAPHHWEWAGPDGRIYDIHDFPFLDLDGSPLVLEAGTDITQRRQDELALAKRTEEVQRQAHQLRALAVDLSQAEQRERRRLAKILHDHIQQLLVAARMQVEWLKRDNDAERIHATAQGVDGILREALEASRSLTVELSPPVLHETGLIGALSWLASRMKEKHQFTVNLRSDNKAEPDSEETRYLLFECARELLFNAVKHAGVKEAHVALLPARDNRIKLIIRDEGKGFDPDLLKKRGAGDTTFGLFSIQQRLAHLGGEMEIVTARGKGTSITVMLPADTAKPMTGEGGGNAIGAERASQLHVRERTIGRRVLVVDDHKIVREGLVGLMQFEPDIEIVGQAADGPQAIELAALLQPDVIVMDVNLGEMSGVEATRRILAKAPKIKVIGLSMHTDKALANAMRDAGAIAYLTKGGRSEDLLAAIRAACAD